MILTLGDRYFIHRKPNFWKKGKRKAKAIHSKLGRRPTSTPHTTASQVSSRYPPRHCNSLKKGQANSVNQATSTPNNRLGGCQSLLSTLQVTELNSCLERQKPDPAHPHPKIYITQTRPNWPVDQTLTSN